MNNEKMLLMGCGILKKEVRFLIKKNNWPVDTTFFNSALHIDFNKLSKSLTSGLHKQNDRDIIVFYGCCHPLMDNMLDHAQTFRTVGQNCVEMLLGKTLFTEELNKGAFFLLEEWAKRWEEILLKAFGGTPEIIREIFKGEHNFLLCIRTPCSEDFSAQAEQAGKMVDLPIYWLDINLDHLEQVLQTAITQKQKQNG